MRQYQFDRPLVECALPVRDTRVYCVNVDEPTRELANIMEFKNGQWQVKHFIDDVDTWERSSARLDIPNKIKLNPNGIIAAWLDGSKYEGNVKEAAADFEYIIGELTDLCTVITNSILSLNRVVDAITTAGATEAANTVSTVASNLNTQLSRLVDGKAIEHLEALDVAINRTN